MDPIAYAQRPLGHQLIISTMQRMWTTTRPMYVSTSIVGLNRNDESPRLARKQKIYNKPKSRWWCNKRVVELNTTYGQLQLCKMMFHMLCRHHEYVLNSNGGRTKSYETQLHMYTLDYAFLVLSMCRSIWMFCTSRSNLYKELRFCDAFSRRFPMSSHAL